MSARHSSHILTSPQLCVCVCVCAVEDIKAGKESVNLMKMLQLRDMSRLVWWGPPPPPPFDGNIHWLVCLWVPERTTQLLSLMKCSFISLLTSLNVPHISVQRTVFHQSQAGVNNLIVPLQGRASRGLWFCYPCGCYLNQLHCFRNNNPSD